MLFLNGLKIRWSNFNVTIRWNGHFKLMWWGFLNNKWKVQSFSKNFHYNVSRIKFLLNNSIYIIYWKDFLAIKATKSLNPSNFFPLPSKFRLQQKRNVRLLLHNLTWLLVLKISFIIRFNNNDRVKYARTLIASPSKQNRKSTQISYSIKQHRKYSV